MQKMSKLELGQIEKNILPLYLLTTLDCSLENNSLGTKSKTYKL